MVMMNNHQIVCKIGYLLWCRVCDIRGLFPNIDKIVDVEELGLKGINRGGEGWWG